MGPSRKKMNEERAKKNLEVSLSLSDPSWGLKKGEIS